jgi:hypothetical protein
MLALCASLLLGACATHGPDHDHDHAAPTTSTPESPVRLPFDPFTPGVAGDWSMYAARGCTLVGGRLMHAEKGALLFKLAAPVGDDVDLRVRDDWRRLDASTNFLADQFDRRSGGMNVVVGPRGTAPTLGDYLSALLREPLFSNATRSAVIETQETYTTAQPREFASKGPGHVYRCTRLTFTLHDGTLPAQVSLWLCPDVRGLGLVALRSHYMTTDLGGPRSTTLDLELFGHGTADETLFGTPKELVFTDE